MFSRVDETHNLNPVTPGGVSEGIDIRNLEFEVVFGGTSTKGVSSHFTSHPEGTARPVVNDAMEVPLPFPVPFPVPFPLLEALHSATSIRTQTAWFSDAKVVVVFDNSASSVWFPSVIPVQLELTSIAVVVEFTTCKFDQLYVDPLVALALRDKSYSSPDVRDERLTVTGDVVADEMFNSDPGARKLIASFPDG